MSEKLLIVGTGRCGTTFLIQLLTRLGCDTGLYEQDGEWFCRLYQKVTAQTENGEVLSIDRTPFPGFRGAAVYDRKISAGCEIHIAREDTAADVAALPEVIKNPRLATIAGRLMDEGVLRVRGAFLPIRDLRDVALSKCQLGRFENQPFYAAEAERLRQVSAEQLGTFVADMVCRNIPLVPIHFPRMVKDAGYLYEQVRQLLPIDSAEFRREFARTADLGQLTVADGRVLRERGVEWAS